MIIGRDWLTFVSELVEPSKGIDLIIAAISDGRIYEARGDIPDGFFNAGTVVSAAPTAFRWTGRHQVCVMGVPRGH